MPSSALFHDLPCISTPEGQLLYGGSQQALPGKALSAAGCGLIACANLLLSLTRFHNVRDGLFDRLLSDSGETIALRDFNACVLKLCRGLLRPIPGFGLTGIAMAWGLNRLFRRKSIPFRAGWCLQEQQLWPRIARMLEADLPVILAIGPNRPRLWGRARLTFYRKTSDGSRQPAAAACAHFVTVTAMDSEWLRISSWGAEYYINRKEYTQYASKHSLWLFCNVLLLKKI